MQHQLTKEEIREARLRAMEGRTESRPSSTPSSTKKPLESIEAPHEAQQEVSMNQSQFDSMMDLLYRKGVATDEDMLRWNNEGFIFCENPPFGLQQHLGGPCGILAVVQGEIIRRLYYSESGDRIRDNLLPIPSGEVETALIDSLSDIMIRITPKNQTNFSLVYLESFQNCELPVGLWNLNEVKMVGCSSATEMKTSIIRLLPQFKSPAGCLLFLLSTIITR
jgi:hypothetical protein